MKKLFTTAFICICLSTFAQSIYSDYRDGHIYVKFKKGTIKKLFREDQTNIPVNKVDAIAELIASYGITKAEFPFYQADDDAFLTHVMEFHFTNHAGVENLIRSLSNNTLIEFAEKVPILTVDVTPNDPTFGAHLTQINAQNAWNVFNSTAHGNSNITVAIVDNAVRVTHADLTANVWVNPGEIANNNIDDDGNGYVDDINGWDVADNDNNPNPTNNSMNHGTHCAGIAGARTDNGAGIASIGWNIKLIGVKCQTDGGNTTSIPYGYQGIIYAAKAKARIISCSFGGTGFSSAAQGVIDYAWNKGSIIIAAAGNNNTSTAHYPAAYNNVYAVASVASNNVKSSFSNFGTWVDISAPGESITSTVPPNSYQSQSGTSMACPLVAGLAALMLSKCPYMLQNDVLNCISSTAANIYTIAANSTYSTGSQLGAGRIEAFQAMNCAAAFLNVSPIANFYTLTRNSCPNTPITFIDSSYYNPTSWSWSFPGGTPATSTSSNPTVSYANPGTYNVSLQVSNINGNNTKVKNSYITIAGPINLPLVEGFQNTTFLPTNWSPYNLENDSVFWKRKLGVGGFIVNASAACAMFDNYNDDATGYRDEMRTPKYIFSNVAAAKLRFDVAYRPYDNLYSDTLVVRISNNCGTNWNTVYTKGGATLASLTGTQQASIFVPTATQWRTDSIDISPQVAFQPNVMAGFVNHGHWGQALYVDNINIFLPAPAITVLNSNTGCTGAAMAFTNNTQGAAGYTWTTNPAATISAPNGTNTNITFNNPGTYSVILTANNGTVLSTLTKTVSIATQPTVSLVTSTTNICSGTTVTLTASGASSYSWSTSQTASSITVAPTGTVSYTVTGTNGTCTDTKISTINATVTPTVSVANQTICASGTATLNASGASTYSWSTGFIGNPLMVSPSTNTVYTVIGNNGVCSDTKTVGVTIGSSITIIPSASSNTTCAGGNINLTATRAITYTWQPGNLNGSSVFVTPATTTNYTVSGSNSGCDGQAVITITVISPPALNISPGTASICAGGNITLNASGYSTYTWNPGNLNGSSINVSPASTQVYSVTGNLGNCVGNNTKTVSVVANPTVSIAGGTFVCAGNPLVLNASGANTYSWNTSATTSSISVSPVTTTTYNVVGLISTCTDMASITVSVNPTPSVSVSTPSNPICIGDGINLTANGANTYSWNTGSTFNTIFIGPTVTTSYTLTGTTDGCSSTVVFTQSVIACGGGVGLEDHISSLSGLLVYPNPFDGAFFVSFLGSNFSYTVYDNLGRVLITESKAVDIAKIDMSGYSKGVYYIEVTNQANKERVRKKIIAD